MRVLGASLYLCAAVLVGCASSPFEPEKTSTPQGPGEGPTVTTPPVITVQVTPETLWAPNHKLVDIRATVAVSDICDPNPTFVLTSITVDEPDNGLGDGNTTGDVRQAAFGTPDTSFQLRSERSGPGNGRVYTIRYTARDMAGNTASATARVTVTHDRR